MFFVFLSSGTDLIVLLSAIMYKKGFVQFYLWKYYTRMGNDKLSL